MGHLKGTLRRIRGARVKPLAISCSLLAPPPAHTSRGSRTLNREDRQERKDIAKDLLRIANKGIFFAFFAFFAVQKGRVGEELFCTRVLHAANGCSKRFCAGPEGTRLQKIEFEVRTRLEGGYCTEKLTVTR